MNERNPQKRIRDYLQQSEVQRRIWQDMQEARSRATVTISRAARLFNFTENQLREWERRGLLQTLREKDGKESTGHRQYSPAELDKLAIIRELLKYGNYSLAEIPLDVDKLWNQVADYQDTGSARFPAQHSLAELPDTLNGKHPFIDSRAEENEQQEFWRYFVAQALRISLSLVCHDIPDSLAGLIVSLGDNKAAKLVTSTDDLSKAGLSMIGWLERNRSFHTFLTDTPQFKFPTDFRLETLRPSYQTDTPEDRVLDNVLIVLQRRARRLSLSPELIETVRRVLDLLYQRVETWRPCFEYGMRDGLHHAHDLERASDEAGDRVFNSLLERVLELGEKAGKHWSFCALLQPQNNTLPIQQQILIVRAQTEHSPYQIGVTLVNPANTDSLSLKAFQSGQLLYFPEILSGQSMIDYKLPSAITREQTTSVAAVGDSQEKSTRSALAIPLVGEYNIPMAVLYVAAESPQAFSIEDQRALRVLSKMVEEMLLTSQVRRQAIAKAGTMISQPTVVDTTFREFASETDFLLEIETLLQDIWARDEGSFREEENLSIVSLDIDDQSSIALKYGNRAARSVSQHMGERIRGQMQLSDRYASGKFFHISADRYFLFLRLSLEEAQKLAVTLKDVLQVAYRIRPTSASPGVPVAPENMLEIKAIL
ncbi:MAG TPA: MerR family transcriptional regulator, partial [Ktedonobacteraceae bacterium]|nr:MerR family transcriptional regulator [Ktedonobacteraceae bacterium]